MAARMMSIKANEKQCEADSRVRCFLDFPINVSYFEIDIVSLFKTMFKDNSGMTLDNTTEGPLRVICRNTYINTMRSCQAIVQL